jgi:hypothetical protein
MTRAGRNGKPTQPCGKDNVVQPHYQKTTMPDNRLPVDLTAPLEGSTPFSAAYQLDKANQERALYCPRMPLQDRLEVIPRPRRVLTMPVQRSSSLDAAVDCGEAIDLAVETFGLQAVIRSLRLVAATNGIDL